MCRFIFLNLGKNSVSILAAYVYDYLYLSYAEYCWLPKLTEDDFKFNSTE